MKVTQVIATVIASIALAIVFIGAGFLVSAAPPCTHALSSYFSDDVTSPFNRTQLTQVANATRDYSFGAHDKSALYQAIYQVDLQLRQEIITANGTVPYGFPELDIAGGSDDERQLGSIFANASELYCYSPETMSHLDDCYNLARLAYTILAIAAIAAVAGLIACGVSGRKRAVGNALFSAGIAVLVIFVAFGVFAAIDFTRFFTLFHQLLFSQGNWTFAYDSLLICALPTEFWIGMGVIWLAVSVLVSILSIAIGAKLRK